MTPPNQCLLPWPSGRAAPLHGEGRRFESVWKHAIVAQSADAPVLGAGPSNGLWVRVPSMAPPS